MDDKFKEWRYSKPGIDAFDMCSLYGDTDLLASRVWQAAVAAKDAEIVELRKNMAWVRAKLRLPEGSQMFSGHDTIAEMLHVWDSHQHGYMAYIEAYKCNDKQGEIARQAAKIRERELQLTELKADRDRLLDRLHGTEELADAREAAWESAELQLAETKAERDRLAAALEKLRPTLNDCVDAENGLHGIKYTASAKRDLRYIRSQISVALLALEATEASEAAKAAGGVE